MERSIACREHMIAASSSSSDDDISVSLGVNQEKAMSLHSMIHTNVSTRRIEKMTFQCKFFLL